VDSPTRGRSGGSRWADDESDVHVRYSEGQSGRHFRDEDGNGLPYWHISIANGNPSQLWVGPDGTVYSKPPTYRSGKPVSGEIFDETLELPDRLRQQDGMG
jgi:hypothetical protein